ncbi:MAG TPA: hypothetical protein DEF42_02925 [Desulfosporosinus sp.]|nr:hypothetical protein [Desulfosporosinus sp.]
MEAVNNEENRDKPGSELGYESIKQLIKDGNKTIANLPEREVEPAQDNLFLKLSGGNIISEQEFIERSLKENQFWMRIMMEHAFALRIPLPNEATKYIKKSEDFQKSFEKQLHKALHETAKEFKAVKKLNEESINLLYEAAEFKEKVFKDNVEGKYRGLFWTMEAEHIRREPLYVIKTLQRLNKRIERPLREDIIEENEFFLKIMAEHGAFLSHFLDMNEDELIELARLFTTKFKLLTLQARNIEIEPPTKTAILSHLTIFRGATITLHDFLVEVSRLAGTGEIRGVMDPNLLGHVTREAAKYLSVLDRLEARVKQQH